MNSNIEERRYILLAEDNELQPFSSIEILPGYFSCIPKIFLSCFYDQGGHQNNEVIQL